jgi:hypothetical protein
MWCSLSAVDFCLLAPLRVPGRGLLFGLNANRERAAFPATVRRGGRKFTRNSLGGTIQ